MHILCAGRTASGKSFLARHLVRAAVAGGNRAVVLDPIGTPWPGAEVHRELPGFEKAVLRGNCLAVIDESGELVGQYNKPMFWLATRARHAGVRSMFITQRPFQLNPTVRDQCTSLFLFQVSRRDSELLADEWGYDAILKAPALPQFAFIQAERFKGFKVCKLEIKK